MRHLFSLLLIISLYSFDAHVSAADIKLPAPATSGGKTLTEALAERRSCRTFEPQRQLSLDQLSALLWAAAGINRADKGKRTNPTALNKQEIDIYIFTDTAVYRYDCQASTLRHIVNGDHRRLVAGGQDFVMDAPVSLVLIADLSKFGAANERSTMMGACDAGIVSQNINLHCAATGLATVPRATMDVEGIRNLLGLSAAQLPILNNPVGYPRK